MKDRITPGEPIPVLQEPAPSREVSRRAEGLTHEVVVNYYRRMKMNRVFPLAVELLSDKRASASSQSPVQIRPVVPGAHVTPALREVHLGNSNAVATFYVTPLARGRLRDARVGIFQDGRLLQEVKLPMKAVSQRMTWILLALTFLIPGLIRYFTVGVDLSQSAASTKAAKATTESAPQEPMLRADEDKNMARTMLGKMSRGSADKAEAAKKTASPRPEVVGGDTRSPQEKEGSQRMIAGMGAMGRGRGAGAGAESTKITQAAPGQGPRKGPLEREITQNTPEPSEVISFVPAIRQPVAHGAQEAYELIQGFEKFNTNAGIFEVQPLSRYSFVLLLVLTVLSWILHRSVRARRRAVPVSLAA
jgi:hypothetical protein